MRVMAIRDSTAKFNSRQYFRLYGILNFRHVLNSVYVMSNLNNLLYFLSGDQLAAMDSFIDNMDLMTADV